MNKIISRIEKRLKEREFKYVLKDDSLYLNITIGEVIGKVGIVITVGKNYYITYVILNNTVPDEHVQSVSEYLHRANEGLIRGNFEFDFDSLEVRYKLTTDFDDPNALSNTQIDMSILIPCAMIKKYGEGIIKLSVGTGTPKELIDEIEVISASE